MALSNDRPYAQFNFLVDFGDGETGGPHAGFAELSGLGTEPPAEKQRKKAKSRTPQIKGLNPTATVTLKRGVIASQAFERWVAAIDQGHANAVRTLVIRLQTEDQSVVRRWTLAGVRITKHTAGPLNAKGTDVAMEELELAYDRLEVE